MNCSRRGFIKIGAAGAAVAALPGCVTAGSKKALPQVGVQLYSVRNLCNKDLLPTLKEIKSIGYAGVEFAGYYGKSAKELKQIIDDMGLKACGTHTGLDSIKPANLNKTIEFAQEVGNKYLMVPSMNANTAEGWVEFAKIFNAAAETAKKSGMYVGYHNHQHEFKEKFDGKCKWEIFFDNCNPDVCSQPDVGHIAAAGEDPVYWFNKFPNRSRTIHAKEVYPGTGILGSVAAGKTGVNWPAVFAATDKDVTEWYVVESEVNPDSTASIRGCFEFLKAQGRV